jgi:hypothetical protein
MSLLMDDWVVLYIGNESIEYDELFEWISRNSLEDWSVDEEEMGENADEDDSVWALLFFLNLRSWILEGFLGFVMS